MEKNCNSFPVRVAITIRWLLFHSFDFWLQYWILYVKTERNHDEAQEATNEEVLFYHKLINFIPTICSWDYWVKEMFIFPALSVLLSSLLTVSLATSARRAKRGSKFECGVLHLFLLLCLHLPPLGSPSLFTTSPLSLCSFTRLHLLLPFTSILP